MRKGTQKAQETFRLKYSLSPSDGLYRLSSIVPSSVEPPKASAELSQEYKEFMLWEAKTHPSASLLYDIMASDETSFKQILESNFEPWLSRIPQVIERAATDNVALFKKLLSYEKLIQFFTPQQSKLTNGVILHVSHFEGILNDLFTSNPEFTKTEAFSTLIGSFSPEKWVELIQSMILHSHDAPLIPILRVWMYKFTSTHIHALSESMYTKKTLSKEFVTLLMDAEIAPKLEGHIWPMLVSAYVKDKNFKGLAGILSREYITATVSTLPNLLKPLFMYHLEDKEVLGALSMPHVYNRFSEKVLSDALTGWIVRGWHVPSAAFLSSAQFVTEKVSDDALAQFISAALESGQMTSELLNTFAMPHLASRIPGEEWTLILVKAFGMGGDLDGLTTRLILDNPTVKSRIDMSRIVLALTQKSNLPQDVISNLYKVGISGRDWAMLLENAIAESKDTTVANILRSDGMSTFTKDSFQSLFTQMTSSTAALSPFTIESFFTNPLVSRLLTSENKLALTKVLVSRQRFDKLDSILNNGLIQGESGVLSSLLLEVLDVEKPSKEALKFAQKTSSLLTSPDTWMSVLIQLVKKGTRQSSILSLLKMKTAVIVSTRESSHALAEALQHTPKALTSPLVQGLLESHLIQSQDWSFVVQELESLPGQDALIEMITKSVVVSPEGGAELSQVDRHRKVIVYICIM